MDIVVHARVDPKAVHFAQVEEDTREVPERRRRRRWAGFGRRDGDEELREELLLQSASPTLGVRLASDWGFATATQGPSADVGNDDVDFKFMLRSLPRTQLDHDWPPALAQLAESHCAMTSGSKRKVRPSRKAPGIPPRAYRAYTAPLLVRSSAASSSTVTSAGGRGAASRRLSPSATRAFVDIARLPDGAGCPRWPARL